jgi:hypothetical protein
MTITFLEVGIIFICFPNITFIMMMIILGDYIFNLLQNEFNYFFKMLKLKTMCYKFQKFIEKNIKIIIFYTCFKLVAKTN